MSRTLSQVSLAFALLLVAPAGAPAASAQEAITLETVGAVRMMDPAELHARDAESRSPSPHPVDVAGASPATER